MKYRVEYLGLALEDLKEMVSYITDELGSPDSASHLATNIVERVNTLSDFPYAYTVYIPIRPLSHEFRKMVVQNYSVFYWIDDVAKLVTVARVLYNKRNIISLL